LVELVFFNDYTSNDYTRVLASRRLSGKGNEMMRKLLMAIAVISPIGLLAATGATPAAAQMRTSTAVSGCAGVVEITHLAFKPAAVAPGSSSTAHMTARNCTGESQSTTSTWKGTYKGDRTDCPVIDPVSQPANFAPNGTVKSKVGYEVPSGCDANYLQVTVELTEGGTILAQKTADLRILKIPSGSG
jgi:hypothetical protein